MTVENFEAQTTDPNGGGQDAGAQGSETAQGTQAQPAERTYTKTQYDAEFATARRAWEYQTEQRLAREKAQWQQKSQPQAQANPNDPWSQFDPQVAQALRAALDRELEARVSPFKTQLEQYQQKQEDLAFANNESTVAAKYKDYTPNRTAILEFGVANGIANIDTAYHAWRSQTQWQDPEVIGKRYLADYQKKKATQSAGMPPAEGRGGGSPSTKTNFRGKDGKLDKDAMDAHALEIIRSANE